MRHTFRLIRSDRPFIQPFYPNYSMGPRIWFRPKPQTLNVDVARMEKFPDYEMTLSIFGKITRKVLPRTMNLTPYDQYSKQGSFGKMYSYYQTNSFSYIRSTLKYGKCRFSCQAIAGGATRGTPIKVIVNGASSELGRAAIVAVSSARGMQLAGAIEKTPGFAGQDAGELAGLEEALEIPVTSDLVMVLASLANAKQTGVLLDLAGGNEAYENIRQAGAFGLKSVILSDSLELDKLMDLQEFCDKSSTGSIVAPTFDIGISLVQQAAITSSFHYTSVDILESLEEIKNGPSIPAQQLASALSDLGKLFRPSSVSLRDGGYIEMGNDGVQWKGTPRSGNSNNFEVRFSSPGQGLSLKHEYDDFRSMIPGILLAIRKVMRLKTLVYGLEKII